MRLFSAIVASCAVRRLAGGEAGGRRGGFEPPRPVDFAVSHRLNPSDDEDPFCLSIYAIHHPRTCFSMMRWGSTTLFTRRVLLTYDQFLLPAPRANPVWSPHFPNAGGTAGRG